MNRNLTFYARVAAAGLLLFAAGCGDDDSETPPPVVPDPGEIGGIQTNHTDPAALIEAHDRAWEEQNHAAYEALLDDEFEFYPLGEDVGEFPWMTGDSWPRGDELSMASHMFDDTYTQGNGAIDLIELDAVPQQTETNDDGRIEVVAVMVGRVMWSDMDGASFDTGVKFELVTREGFLRIREIEEIPRNLAGRGDAVREGTSWGQIKANYR